MVNAQEQALGTEKSWQNQALFRKYTAVDGDLKKPDCHGGGISLPFPTGGPDNRVFTGVHTHHASTTFLQIQGDWQNQPQGECSEDDGALWPRGTPCLIDRIIGKGERIRGRRMADDLQRHDDVQRDHLFGADGCFQQQHPRVEK